MKPLFFYGSLRDPELLEIVLGRPVGEEELTPAEAPGFAARLMADEAYPALVEANGRAAPGVLLDPPGGDELDRLAFFEEAEYGLAPVTVRTADGEHEAQYFRGTGKTATSDANWDYEQWRRRDRAVAVEAARELMASYGRYPVERIDEIWPGIMNRARQRVRARASPPAPGNIGHAFGPKDLEVTDHHFGYSGYLSVEEMTLRHRRYDGGWLGPVRRTATLWGDAVTVLPYDAAADRVMLIEQFRPGPAVRGDPSPWCIEVIAGRIDTDEDAEAVARREAEEEGGVTLGRIERIGGYYTTPGLAGEHITGFLAEAHLAGKGGVHGRADEHEDIRAIVLDFDEAMQAVGDGAVNTGPALIPLLWLARERGRLRAQWA